MNRLGDERRGDTGTRGHTYELLSRLYLEGITGETLPYVEAIPELAAKLSEEFDPDEAAADYQHLFGFNIFPYQSIFLDPAVLLGGQVTDDVTRSYRAAGFILDSMAESADHIGHELQFMAVLCTAESEAW